jgi:hypothetical protein
MKRNGIRAKGKKERRRWKKKESKIQRRREPRKEK